MIFSKTGSTKKSHAPLGRGSLQVWGPGGGTGGFTLIELLVVIAIIGILASIILSSLSNARKRGRDTRRIADSKQLQLALELYYDANQAYPTTLVALVAPGYIPAIPKDPSTNNAYAYAALQGAGTTAATCASYHLGVKLETNNAAQSGSPFLDDADTIHGGTYGTGSGDGTVCTNGSWAGGDIAAVSGDFDGDNDSVNLVYDMRP